ncbi:MAG: hypothetical protein [Cressdnaviricota sp.]|nr:MAG: hypothetical protein [Cressdnaviricota sp.]
MKFHYYTKCILFSTHIIYEWNIATNMTKSHCGLRMRMIDWGFHPLTKKEWVTHYCDQCDHEETSGIEDYSLTCCNIKPSVKYELSDGYVMICFDCGKIVSRHPYPEEWE